MSAAMLVQTWWWPGLLFLCELRMQRDRGTSHHWKANIIVTNQRSFILVPCEMINVSSHIWYLPDVALWQMLWWLLQYRLQGMKRSVENVGKIHSWVRERDEGKCSGIDYTPMMILLTVWRMGSSSFCTVYCLYRSISTFLETQQKAYLPFKTHIAPLPKI